MKICVRWHEEDIERREVNLLSYNKFDPYQNPFMSGVFLYDGKFYSCNSHQQVLLYFFFYGLHYQEFDPLVKIPTGRFVEVIPSRNIFRVLHKMSRTNGIKEADEYTWALNKIYEEAVLDRLPLSFIYYQVPLRDSDVNWLKEKILDFFPNIIKELHQSYPKIRLFL